MTNQNPPPARRKSTLYKDPTDKKIAGVASGVAKYFDVDTTLVRAIWAVSVLAGGFGLVLYLVLWFILDDEPEALAAPAPPTPVEPAIVDVPSQEMPSDERALEVAQEEIEAKTGGVDVELPADG
jgi:phage shock protein C